MADILEINEALVKLQEELEKFKTATEKLDEAKRTSEVSLSKWKSQHEKDQKILEKTSKALTKSIQTLEDFAENSQNTMESLSELAKSIDNVNFPNRLDKIDNNTSLLSAQTENLQTNLSREYDLLTQMNTQLSEMFADVQKRVKGNRILVWCFGILLILAIAVSTVLPIWMQ